MNYSAWLTSGTIKGHLRPKRKSEPNPPTHRLPPLTILRNTKKLGSKVQSFLNGLNRTMGVKAFLMVGYMGDDDVPHTAR